METKSNYSVPIAIVLAGVIIAGALYFSDSKKVTTSESINSNQPLKVNIKNVKTVGEPFIGDPNAPVVIAEWFDYQCPACQYADQKLITPLVADYVKAGKVKVVFKDFAFLGPDSYTLAITARAVWEAYPEKFYEWHKALFDNQGQENTGWATKAVIDDITKKVPGIDVAVIDGLIAKNSTVYQKMIEDDKNEGSQFGINSTPSFIINDQLIAGAPQYVQLKSYLETLLTK